MRIFSTAAPACGVLAALLAIAAQWATVTVNYHGAWTALYDTGSLAKPPPKGLASEHIYMFSNSDGYDGQAYHYIAHDPFFRRGFAASIDQPRLRSRRILVPLLAFLLALGQDRWIDPAYIAVVAGWVLAGTYWLSRLAVREGFHAGFGLGFLLAPAVLVSLDRLTIDVALAACCIGFALYARDGGLNYKLWRVLAIAALSRETGCLLAVACVLYFLAWRRWRDATLSALAILPALAWYVFVDFHTGPDHSVFISPALFTGLIDRLIHRAPSSSAPIIAALASFLDVLALGGIIIAVGWAVYAAFRRSWKPLTIAIYLFAVLTAVLAKGDAWSEVYAFGRSLTPLLLLSATDGLAAGSIVPALAMLAVDPRIALQCGGQIMNVMRTITH